MAPSCCCSARPRPGRGLSAEPQLESARWVEHINRAYASLFTAFVVHANRVGFEDGLNFWGGSTAFDPNGELIVKAPYHEEALTLAEIDLNQLHRTRARLPLLRDERTALVMREMQGRDYAGRMKTMIDLSINTDLARTILTGFHPQRDHPRRVFTRGDRPFWRAGLGPVLLPGSRSAGAENVLAVRMPYRTSSPDSLEHAQMVIDALGVQSLTIPITEMVDPLFERFPELARCGAAISWRACA